MSALQALALCYLLRTSLLAQNTPSAPVNLQVIVVDSAQKAQQILDRLKKDGHRAALAKEQSLDPSASQGGFLGAVDPATLRPELREALKGVGPGQMTGVIAVRSAYVILRVLAGNPPAVGQGMGPGQGTVGQRMGPGQGPDLLLTGTGAMVYPAHVAGQVRTDMLFQKFPKPANWGQDLGGICDVRTQSLALGIARLEELFDPAGQARLTAMTPFDVIQTHYALAQLLAYRGNTDKAIKHWEAAYKIAMSNILEGMPQLTEVLGVAYLHKSEMENDIYRHPADRCLFPPRGARPYQKTEDSEKAIQYFLKYLAEKPERIHQLQVKWLLNLAYMTLGKYPSGFPREYLIPPSVFESTQDIGRFVDVAPAAGLDLVTMANGIIADGFEN